MTKKKKKKTETKPIEEVNPIDSDDNFAFIAGCTSGGAPYGMTHEEMAELDKELDETDKIKQ